MKKVSLVQARKLVAEARCGSRIHGITFIKKDGSHRKAQIRFNVKKGLTGEGSSVDFEIGRIAGEKKMAVCTQDRELIARLKTLKVPVITLRQGKYLIMI